MRSQASDRFVFFALLKSAIVALPVPEFRFHPIRRWRFDYAWPDERLALEVEGGIWIGGRHNRGSGFVKDMEKYNRAACMGWRIIRCQPNELTKLTTISLIKEALECQP